MPPTPEILAPIIVIASSVFFGFVVGWCIGIKQRKPWDYIDTYEEGWNAGVQAHRMHHDPRMTEAKDTTPFGNDDITRNWPKST